jgi:uncharacterized Fe-S cluster-containing protein
MARFQPFKQPYFPTTHDVRLIDGSFELVDTEELDTVAEFMDNYEANLEKQFSHSNRIVPIRALVD